jgi:hypothetical protein
MIVEMSRGSSQSLEHGSSATSIAAVEAFRALLIADYKREQTNLENSERLRKAAQKSIDTILSEFETHFPGEDIEIAAKSDEVSASSARIKPKTSTDIIDYTALEKDRVVIGQRSKYYLEYGTTIQYFKNNYSRNQKVKSLEEQSQDPVASAAKVVISVNTANISSNVPVKKGPSKP